ncbi:winged helix-turn-helix transcriptional regulator [Nakamurella flavida]|uniref:Winged helix-turn-helix transcriptional regulator n=1 Tax=Nakamurella flavida TaxID=363630 RepID=A0A938YQS5_9ACTN|nr:metalloregulator ArsR/SmtB family transcription factor [Nakamurella flavida]MBM9477732.1 winged helix-turn-helix transcriptional regulator [Nakamurella flavida]
MVDDRDIQAGLDRAFLALADPVRRAIVARLSRGPATVTELAEPHAISTQAVSRHIQVLELAGLVTRSRDAQRRPVHLAPAALAELTAWIDEHRLAHERRFRALDAVLTATRTPPTITPGTHPAEQEEP